MCGQVEPYLQLHICTLSNFIDLIGCLGKTLGSFLKCLLISPLLQFQSWCVTNPNTILCLY